MGQSIIVYMTTICNLVMSGFEGIDAYFPHYGCLNVWLLVCSSLKQKKKKTIILNASTKKEWTYESELKKKNKNSRIIQDRRLMLEQKGGKDAFIPIAD